jgi:flagellar basal-body rod modification protein FlgD
MTDAIKATGTDATTTPNASPAPAQKPLDREAFLKLLVAQISHQDPLQPMQGTEFVAQLSQFATVEQAIAQSARMEDMNAQLRGLSNSQATSLVGKRVTVRGQGMAFDGALATTQSVSLSAPAARVTASIVDASGRTVRTIELGARQAGPTTVTWDGKDQVGQTAPKGSYTLRVEARDAAGAPVTVTQDVSGTVTRVAFDKGYPEILLDSGATAPISELVSVEGKTP